MDCFFNNCNAVLPINNIYNNQSCFLIVGGPSLNTLDLHLLNQPGIITMGVNNSVSKFRPNLWVSVDDPANFILSIWQDPKIQKFVMYGKRNKVLWDNIHWQESKLTVAECPNVIYYRDNEHFKPTEEFLTEQTINWGNHTDRCECGFFRVKDEKNKKIKICPKCNSTSWGSRSVMLAAIKILYLLGFKKVFIIGADFKMADDKKYAWPQNRSRGSVNGNNETYSRLNKRFSQLRPIFEKNDFFVFNATPNSELHSFVKIDYIDAVKIALHKFPNVNNERTYGMYDRKAIEKKVTEQNKKMQEYKARLKECNGTNIKLAKRLSKRLEQAQIKYKDALMEKEKLITWTA